MNRVLGIFLILLFTVSCKNSNNTEKRVAIAKAGDEVLYLDQIPKLIFPGTSKADSTVIVQNYINKWAKKELMFMKAEENLSPELKADIDNQLEEARANLVIYQYQRQMILERMDTLLTDSEMENYYSANEKSFLLNSNIVKALFIKLPVETPNIDKIKTLARSNEQNDLQQLEAICYQFAEKFDDFDEAWVPLDRISVELPEEINNEENFLRRTTFFESSDSTWLYFVTIRDYRLRSTLAPYEYVKDDIKRILWNSRRIEFIQSLENGIYNDALKENKFKIFNN
ncbi:MAG: hypothetical protein NTZ85_12365 [Bacteroidia bacterium]|jgi:hypothetical protein|nr:hypothetical protein [Bacteroidia bacterium]